MAASLATVGFSTQQSNYAIQALDDRVWEGVERGKWLIIAALHPSVPVGVVLKKLLLC
jgi:hypothetical protein